MDSPWQARQNNLRLPWRTGGQHGKSLPANTGITLFLPASKYLVRGGGWRLGFYSTYSLSHTHPHTHTPTPPISQEQNTCSTPAAAAAWGRQGSVLQTYSLFAFCPLHAFALSLNSTSCLSSSFLLVLAAYALCLICPSQSWQHASICWHAFFPTHAFFML